jgi:hypothetical protein
MFSTRPKFVHRQNSDGSYDSICTACVMTAASVEHEWQLLRWELMHVCDPVNLYRVIQGHGMPSPRSGPIAARTLRTSQR